MTDDRFGEAAAGLAGAAGVVLGWRPKEFWEATPAELALALQLPGGAVEPVSGELIEALKQRFPDERG